MFFAGVSLIKIITLLSRINPNWEKIGKFMDNKLH